jgi:hypothetical protein
MSGNKPKKRNDLYEKWQADGEEEEKLATLKTLSAQGESMEIIAQSVGIGERQLRTLKARHTAVSSALKKGRFAIVAEMQGLLMEKAREGNIAAIIYALKVFGGEFFNDSRKKDYLSIEKEESNIIILPPNAQNRLNALDAEND